MTSQNYTTNTSLKQRHSLLEYTLRDKYQTIVQQLRKRKTFLYGNNFIISRTFRLHRTQKSPPNTKSPSIDFEFFERFKRRIEFAGSYSNRVTVSQQSRESEVSV
jgi:hypothetical protein